MPLIELTYREIKLLQEMLQAKRADLWNNSIHKQAGDVCNMRNWIGGYRMFCKKTVGDIGRVNNLLVKLEKAEGSL